MANSLKQMREDALAIFAAGLAAVEPKQAIYNHLRRDGDLLFIGEMSLDLSTVDRVLLTGAGKAAGPMAAAVEQILGERLDTGLVVTKYGHGCQLQKTRLLEAGHPVPDANGLEAGRDISELLGDTGQSDLVIVVISGGGSALLPSPPPQITLAEKMQVTELLLGCGATINEMNTVRKHLSELKGGGLARLAAPARVVTLILSDVVGDPLDVIASGPTVADPSTFASALSILDRYQIAGKVPKTVLTYLQAGVAGKVKETPKAEAPCFLKVDNLIVANNAMAVFAAADKAAELGYNKLVLSTTVTGETQPVAEFHAALAREISSSGNPASAPACLLSGGETTVTLKGSGKGGRNQEFALAAALAIQDLPNCLIFSAGTDGTDGPTDAAGAFADGSTVRRGRSQNMDAIEFLNENNAYPFFDRLNDLLKTGPTNTNVMDLHLIMVKNDPT